VRDHLNHGAVLAREIGDQPRLAQITAFEAHYYSIMAGQSLPALDRARRAEAIAQVVGAPVLIGLCRYILGQALHGHGDYAEAISILRANMEALKGDLLSERGGLGADLAAVPCVACFFSR
jgi:hypothetical protein